MGAVYQAWDEELEVAVALKVIRPEVMADPLEAQKWYVQHFGATPGKRLQFETANVPGTEITLGKADAPQLPTKGRSVSFQTMTISSSGDNAL
jgi:hypothetical protein